MGFESMLRSDNPQRAARADQLPQFFGLGSITQELLDKAERERRSTVLPDPFGRVDAPSGATLVKKFNASRQPEA